MKAPVGIFYGETILVPMLWPCSTISNILSGWTPSTNQTFSTNSETLPGNGVSRSERGPKSCAWTIPKVQNRNRNKRSKRKKICLEVLDRSKNMLSVQHGFELLCGNNRLPIQLLLSSEIGPFEDQPSKNP